MWFLSVVCLDVFIKSVLVDKRFSTQFTLEQSFSIVNLQVIVEIRFPFKYLSTHVAWSVRHELRVDDHVLSPVAF